MSIRVGVYEFFARTIPGGFYLFTALYLCSLFGLVKTDWQTLNGVSVIWAFIFAIVAFVAGTLMDSFSVEWHRLFRPKSFRKVILKEFKALHDDWEIKIHPKDWPILIAYLRRDKPETVNEIESHHAVCIMLRNVSLNLMVLAVTQLVLLFRGVAFWRLGLLILLITSSILLALQATKHRRWFYTAIFEALMAQSLSRDDYVQKVQRNLQTENQLKTGDSNTDDMIDANNSKKQLVVSTTENKQSSQL